MDNSRNFTNMAINNVTNDSVTFSYDLPPMYDRYNDEEIYRDILTAVAGTAGSAAQAPGTTTTTTNHRRYDDNGDPTMTTTVTIIWKWIKNTHGHMGTHGLMVVIYHHVTNP